MVKKRLVILVVLGLMGFMVLSGVKSKNENTPLKILIVKLFD